MPREIIMNVGESGDVFLIPLERDKSAVGQVITVRYSNLYVAIFGREISRLHDDLVPVVWERPIFLTLTLDAKLFHGHWQIVGNFVDNLESFPRPAFKVGLADGVHIESLDAKSTRKASEIDIQ